MMVREVLAQEISLVRLTAGVVQQLSLAAGMAFQPALSRPAGLAVPAAEAKQRDTS
jgi:hypothetical protein